MLELEFTNPANVQKVIYMENNKKKKVRNKRQDEGKQLSFSVINRIFQHIQTPGIS